MVSIITDSSSEFLVDEQKRMKVKVVPMPINFGDENYLSGVTLSNKEFYDKLKHSKVMPTTSMVNSFDFAEAFKKEVAKGNDVVAITISSELSVTHQQAVIAAEEVDAKKVFVVDSRSASLGQAWLVYEAVRLRDEGKSAKEICTILTELAKKVKVIAVVDTLKYLKAGGRLSGTAALIGTVLNVKPLVGIEDGKVVSVNKAIGKNNAIKTLISTAKKYGVDTSQKVIFAYSDSSGVLDEFKEKFYENFDVENEDTVQIGVTIGVHVGHGAVAIAFLEK